MRKCEKACFLFALFAFICFLTVAGGSAKEPSKDSPGEGKAIHEVLQQMSS